MTVVMVDGGEITTHASVDAAKAAAQKEFDDMYGEPVQMKWWFDGFDGQWYGHIVGHDEMLTIKEIA